jgi:hypothetical protein
MARAAWQTHVAGHAGFGVTGDCISVGLDRHRSHSVQVIEHEDGWELSGCACTAGQLSAANLDNQDLWFRNRSLDLVAYVVDADGDVWVTAWLPFVGLTSAEFLFATREIAIEADRLEFHVTGLDDH